MWTVVTAGLNVSAVSNLNIRSSTGRAAGREQVTEWCSRTSAALHRMWWATLVARVQWIIYFSEKVTFCSDLMTFQLIYMSVNEVNDYSCWKHWGALTFISTVRWRQRFMQKSETSKNSNVFRQRTYFSLSFLKNLVNSQAKQKNQMMFGS